MAYVYRYRDKKDKIIKYVGIVWAKNRTLEERIAEHEKDDWVQTSQWDIEYITEDIKTRTDAEYIESHYISKYETDKYYNKSKSGWGVSNFINSNDDWKILNYNLFVDKKNINDFKIEDGFCIRFDYSKPYLEIEEIKIKSILCNEKNNDKIHCKKCGSNDYSLREINGEFRNVCNFCGTKGTNRYFDLDSFDENGNYIKRYVLDNNFHIKKYRYYVSGGKKIGTFQDLYIVHKPYECNTYGYIYGFNKIKCLECLEEYLFSRRERMYVSELAKCNTILELIKVYKQQEEK